MASKDLKAAMQPAASCRGVCTSPTECCHRAASKHTWTTRAQVLKNPEHKQLYDSGELLEELVR